jgi:hypothetical protein
MERDEKRKQRRRSEALAAPSDWPSHMERMTQQGPLK